MDMWMLFANAESRELCPLVSKFKVHKGGREELFGFAMFFLECHVKSLLWNDLCLFCCAYLEDGSKIKFSIYSTVRPRNTEEKSPRVFFSPMHRFQDIKWLVENYCLNWSGRVASVWRLRCKHRGLAHAW